MTTPASRVRCPTCGARPGVGCVSVHARKPCRKPHRQRVTAAAKRDLRPRPKRRRAPRPSIPPEVRAAVRKRSGGRCEARTIACQHRAAHMHHVLPRSAGGPDTAENLLHCCSSCHRYVHDHPTLSYERGWLQRRGSTRPGG